MRWCYHWDNWDWESTRTCERGTIIGDECSAGSLGISFTSESSRCPSIKVNDAGDRNMLFALSDLPGEDLENDEAFGPPDFLPGEACSCRFDERGCGCIRE